MPRLALSLLAVGLLAPHVAGAADPNAPTLRITHAAICCDRVDPDHRRLGCSLHTDFEIRNPGPATLQLRLTQPDPPGHHSALPEWPGPYQANGLTVYGMDWNCTDKPRPTPIRQTIVLGPGEARGFTVQALPTTRTRPVVVGVGVLWARSPDDPDIVTELRSEVPWSLPTTRGRFHDGECRDYRLWPDGVPAAAPRRGRDRVYPTPRRLVSSDVLGP